MEKLRAHAKKLWGTRRGRILVMAVAGVALGSLCQYLPAKLQPPCMALSRILGLAGGQ